MTVSFDNHLSTDKDWVRFHIGDTNPNGAYLQDETIAALLTAEGSVGGASVACIRFIISQLASPDFKQDWMSVSNEAARKGFEDLLDRKMQELGVAPTATASATISLPYRADSYQDSDESVYDGSP